ncbi:protein of unknown function [Pararobbsia alpina]
MRYEYVFNVVDADERETGAGACSFETDEPIAHMVRGAIIALKMSNSPADQGAEYGVVRVVLRPEVAGYEVKKQVVHVRVRPVASA